MTLRERNVLVAALAVLLAAPALAEDPAPPAAPATKIDLPPVAEKPTGQRLPGKVIWFDLLSHDAAKVRPFYEAVLGWSFEAREGGYLVARDAGQPVAGILQMPAPGPGVRPQQSRWMPLISVADVAKAAAAVKKAGGRIVEGPGTLGRRGPYAAASDPRGAQFVLIAAAGGDPVDADAPPPGWLWAELWTDDLKGSATFYRAVVGYEVWQVGAGKQASWIYASGGRPRARSARMPFDKVPAQWLPYVVVKDLKGSLAKVPELGGTVLRKPGAKGPQFAVVSDPAGATFILEQRPEVPVDATSAAPGGEAAAVAGATAAIAGAVGPSGTAATTTFTPAPPPPVNGSPDPYGIEAAQKKTEEEQAAAAAAAESGAFGAVAGPDTAVVVGTPAPFVNVWIAPPAWGAYWGPGWWGMAPGWVGAPWWGMPGYWGPGYVPPPYYPGRPPGYWPGYRPPPGTVAPGGPRPGNPGYRPPAAPPRGGAAPATRPAPSAPRPSSPAPASRAPAPAPRR
jgi:uncharacterized protein